MVLEEIYFNIIKHHVKNPQLALSSLLKNSFPKVRIHSQHLLHIVLQVLGTAIKQKLEAFILVKLHYLQVTGYMENATDPTKELPAQTCSVKC